MADWILGVLFCTAALCFFFVLALDAATNCSAFALLNLHVNEEGPKGLSVWPITTGVTVVLWEMVGGRWGVKLVEEDLSGTCFVALKKCVFQSSATFSWSAAGVLKSPSQLQYIVHPQVISRSHFALGVMIGCSMFCVFYVFSALSSAFMHTECAHVWAGHCFYHKRFLSGLHQGPRCCRGETRLITTATPHTVATLCNATPPGKTT